jgi:hypothetical protein
VNSDRRPLNHSLVRALTALDLQFDSSVILFTVSVSLATGILFGLAPAWQSSRPNLVTELKERTSVPSGSHWYSIRNLLVVGQVGLSFIALASAGLFLRSLGNAQRIDPGFDADRLLILGVLQDRFCVHIFSCRTIVGGGSLGPPARGGSERCGKGCASKSIR